MEFITQWDFSILDGIAAHRTGAFDAFFSTITHLGDGGILWIILAAALLCFKKTRRLGICVAIALIFDLLVCNLCIKPLVGRIRPYELRPISLLIRAPKDSSFPSGHTAASFAAFAALAFRRSRLAILAGILAVAIAFSRLYLYVHYPTDVLGGILIGLLCGALACFLCRLIFKAKEH